MYVDQIPQIAHMFDEPPFSMIKYHVADKMCMGTIREEVILSCNIFLLVIIPPLALHIFDFP